MKLAISQNIRRKGFTLIELLVVVVIILGLSGMTLVVINMASKRAEDVQCSSNLKDLWLAAQAYSNDWNGRLPANGMYDDEDTPEDESRGWMVALASYVYGASSGMKVPNLDGKFRCPSDTILNRRDKTDMIPATQENVSYVPWTDGSDNRENPQSQINMSRGFSQLNVPWLSDGVEISELRNVINAADYEKYVAPAEERHGEKINVLYVGGAVRMVDSPSFLRIFPEGDTKAYMNR